MFGKGIVSPDVLLLSVAHSQIHIPGLNWPPWPCPSVVHKNAHGKKNSWFGRRNQKLWLKWVEVSTLKQKMLQGPKAYLMGYGSIKRGNVERRPQITLLPCVLLENLNHLESLIYDGNWLTRGCKQKAIYIERPLVKLLVLATIGLPGGSTKDLWTFGR